MCRTRDEHDGLEPKDYADEYYDRTISLLDSNNLKFPEWTLLINVPHAWSNEARLIDENGFGYQRAVLDTSRFTDEERTRLTHLFTFPQIDLIVACIVWNDAVRRLKQNQLTFDGRDPDYWLSNNVAITIFQLEIKAKGKIPNFKAAHSSLIPADE